jgi:HSP20 family molecular chaperone IbpA
MSSTCLNLEPEPLATTSRELRANVFSHGWGVVVEVFVPGCGAKDIKIRLTGDVLTVEACIRLHASALPVVRERDLGECEREFALNPDLDIARLTRSICDGVLTLVIPRHGALLAPVSAS